MKIILMRWITMMVTVVVLLLQTWLTGPWGSWVSRMLQVRKHTKCNCETIPRQINFITDESGETGKGANAVISRLHFFFENHGLGEKMSICWQLCWPEQEKFDGAILDVEDSYWQAQYSPLLFLVVGHTKFAPDGSFGLLKYLFKCTKVGSIAEIEEVINQSAVCNAQVVCHEDRSMIVPCTIGAHFLHHISKRLLESRSFITSECCLLHQEYCT